MTAQTNNLPDLAKVERIIRDLYKSPASRNLHYHSLAHSEEVVRRSQEIGQAEGISDTDMTILLTAAWFHDVGHLTGGLDEHEARGVAIMREKLGEMGVQDEAVLRRIEDTIYATRFPHYPKDKLGEIICDADTFHLGTTSLQDTNKLVKKELKERGYDDQIKEFRESTLKLLESHHFFTPYVSSMMAAGKSANIQWAQERVLGKSKKNKKAGKEKESDQNESTRVEMKPVAAAIAAGTTYTAPQAPAAESVGQQQPTAPATAQGPDLSEIAAAGVGSVSGEALPNTKAAAKQQASLQARGIQTILRLASENHLELSSLADGKANILISVNAIIISVILSVLIRRLEIDTYLTIPTIIFLASSVITIVIAIMATRPKLTEGSFTREDVAARKTNLLFFGNFYKTKLEDYEWAMQRLMQDTDYIYGSLIKDIYFIGAVLGRKYKLIRLAYNVFMIGIILSVITFTLAVLLNKPEQSINVTNGSTPPL